MTREELKEVIRIADARNALSRTSAGVSDFHKEVYEASLKSILKVCGCNSFRVYEALHTLPDGENIRESMEENIRKAIAKEVAYVKLRIDRCLTDESRKLAGFHTSGAFTNEDEFKEVYL